ncbi:MAG: VOC family protein [Chloroflexi bacterium]|nr:VOC family protein [Chloroflexota bacterium]
MPRVIHFEIHADNPARAIAFYSNVFGWQFNKWEGPVDYWLVVTGPDNVPGINGGLLQRQGAIDGQAVIAYVCTIDVPSLDAYIEKIVANGGIIVLPKQTIPGVGWNAYAKDTEGNILGIHQADPTAHSHHAQRK